MVNVIVILFNINKLNYAKTKNYAVNIMLAISVIKVLDSIMSEIYQEYSLRSKYL